MMKVPSIYLDIIRFSLNPDMRIPDGISGVDWNDFFSFSSRQGVAGIVFDGLMKSEVKIPKGILYQWFSMYQTIKNKNIQLNQRTVEITDYFNKHGYKSCILKGQANACMYPTPEIRSPGDIDIWVDADRLDLIRFVTTKYPDAHYSIHHVKFPVYPDDSVEVHYRPIYLTNWFVDKHLQKYVDVVKDSQFNNKVTIKECGQIGSLTDSFNAIYQILHMFAHFFSTRNNFKQYVDYFYLLRRELSAEEKHECETLFKKLKVYKYVTGIMWIQKEILGMDEKYLIVPADERVGSLLFNETLHYGTFSSSKLSSVIEQSIGNFRLLWHFPSNVLLSPFFLLWHQFWKLKIKKDISKSFT